MTHTAARMNRTNTVSLRPLGRGIKTYMSYLTTQKLKSWHQTCDIILSVRPEKSWAKNWPRHRHHSVQRPSMQQNWTSSVMVCTQRDDDLALAHMTVLINTTSTQNVNALLRVCAEVISTVHNMHFKHNAFIIVVLSKNKKTTQLVSAFMLLMTADWCQFADNYSPLQSPILKSINSFQQHIFSSLTTFCWICSVRMPSDAQANAPLSPLSS